MITLSILENTINTNNNEEEINISKNLIVYKSFNFSLDVINLYRYLITSKKEYTLSKQLLRSGTSIGANVKEGVNGFSKADFRYKMSIALKEANESEYWIELLIKSKIISEDESCELLDKCGELCRILSSIVKKCTIDD